MVKFGIIGSGAWGTKVIKAIRGLGYDVSVCNRHGEFEGLTVCRDYKDLIPQVDIVWVATHPSTNCQIAEFAIGCGKPTVVEKPVAFTSQEVARLVQASRDTRVPLIVDYIYLFNRGLLAMLGPERPIVVEATNRIVERVKSPLRHLIIRMLSDGPIRDYSAMWDWGSHAVAIALDALGEVPTRISINVHREEGLRFNPVFLFWGSTWESPACSIHVSNEYKDGRKIEVEADGFLGSRTFVDDLQFAPLQTLINKIARLHLRGEYWTNGDLAVEVTDVLERLHKMLPK